MILTFLSAVFLDSQLASQVLVRGRRANQVFEELKTGNVVLICTTAVVPFSKNIFKT